MFENIFQRRTLTLDRPCSCGHFETVSNFSLEMVWVEFWPIWMAFGILTWRTVSTCSSDPLQVEEVGCPEHFHTCHSSVIQNTCHSIVIRNTCHSSFIQNTCHSILIQNTCHSSLIQNTRVWENAEFAHSANAIFLFACDKKYSILTLTWPSIYSQGLDLPLRYSQRCCWLAALSHGLHNTYTNILQFWTIHSVYYTVCITHTKALSVSTCSHWDCAFSCWSCCHPHSAAAAKNPWKYKKSPSTLSSCCKKSKKIYIHWKAAAKKYTNPRKYKKSPSALSSCCKKNPWKYKNPESLSLSCCCCT